MVLGKSTFFKQSEALMHFSNEASKEKFLLVDLERADYKLYGPDVATTETLIEAQSAEECFILAILEKQRLIFFLQQTNAMYFVLS